MKTVAEKVAYNQKRGTQFSVGYVFGVKAYNGYSQKDKKGKQAAKKAMDEFSRQAKSGDKFFKGIMCGIRDAANERKSKKQ